MPWWGWVTLGIVLLIAEVLTSSGFFLFFFGLGALIVAGLTSLVPELQEWAQVLLFAVSSAILVVLFRGRAARLLAGPSSEPDALVGTYAVATEEITLASSGRVELRGSIWSAQNVGPSSIQSGQRCEVVAVSGVTLQVKAVA